jgi:hypothetical protein
MSWYFALLTLGGVATAPTLYLGVVIGAGAFCAGYFATRGRP